MLPSGLRVLYIGPILTGSTTLQRLRAFEQMGCDVTPVSTAREYLSPSAVPTLLGRLRNRLLGPRDETEANKSMIAIAGKQHFDLVWIDKGVTIQPKTLLFLKRQKPECRIIGFSPDDMLNPANQSRRFLKCLPLYDAFVTTKSFNVGELQDLGCRRVLFMQNGFDPAVHRPIQLTRSEKLRLGGSVGFIGQWEEFRAASLRSLSLSGISVRVWGYTWERMTEVPVELRVENTPLWDDEYSKAVCAFDINLCFLRKCNRDLQTTRSIEIPACGGFMLAERTAQHCGLFKEGVEAEFFSSDQELIEKSRYYLAHPEHRRAIARRGYERCITSGYSYASRLREVLQAL